MHNPFTLNDKTILVTGASSGIGRAIAIACAGAGASVILTARNLDRLSETLGSLDMTQGQAHSIIAADLLKKEESDCLINALPKLDGVALCSGKGLTLPFQFSTREKFNDIFETNFFSPAELLRQLYKNKLLNKEASVVVIASMGGTHIFSGGNGIYGASKAALDSLMKFCAKEFAPRKVRVNTICPAMIDTPLIHRGTITDEQLTENAQIYPLKRYGHPEDVAYAAQYLLSDASSWVTGTSMIIDGGLSIS